MDTATKNRYEEVIKSLREPGDVHVGFNLTYESLRMWLIKPKEHQGCAFDSAFVDKLLPMILQNIVDGKLNFKLNNNHEFEMYCKQRCVEYHDALTVEAAAAREKLMHEEFLNQQKEGLVLIDQLTKQIQNLKRWKTWLLITLPLSLMALALLSVMPQLPALLLQLFSHLGGL